MHYHNHGFKWSWQLSVYMYSQLWIKYEIFNKNLQILYYVVDLWLYFVHVLLYKWKANQVEITDNPKTI